MGLNFLALFVIYNYRFSKKSYARIFCHILAVEAVFFAISK